MNVIVILVLLAIVAVLVWYFFFFRGETPAPAGPATAPPPLPNPDEETEPNCADPATHDPRCTILYKLLTKTVGASVEGGIEGCSRELAKMASDPPYDIYAIEERIDGRTVQTMFYERVHNMSQEFLIAVSDDNVVERVEAVDKMLKPGEMLAANGADIGEEYSKFISPLEPDALHG